ncbi:MAG: PfkB family carbohydrate kinase [Actinomycetota bacterium]|nr:PfkB family carbohydrate kinase [Actinomycetota bacterium]MEE3125629.1 PfkB family carbohydrate kinase [Actinomycetota bacterium]
MRGTHVVVVGGINADLKARTTAPLVPGTSNPGTATLTPGGVGRNVAENLAHLGRPVALVGVVGDDDLGRLVLEATAAAGVEVSHVRTHRGPTGSYTALLDHRGELVAGIADMAAADSLAPEDVRAATDTVAGAGMVVLDGNLPVATFAVARDLAAEHGVPVVVDPVSVPKAVRLADEVRDLLAVTPSRGELEALGGVDALLARGVALVWERRGASGSVLHAASGAGAVELAAPVAEVVDVTGAGDAMLAAWCHAVLSGQGHTEAAAYAHEAAALTVASPLTVRPDLGEMLAR